MDTTPPRYGVVPTETLLAHDGLDFLRGILEGTLPAPPMAGTLGFRLVSAAHGRVAFEGEPQFRHYNPMGTVHAGLAATLLDSALGCAVHSTLKAGEAYTTLEIKVNLVRPLTGETGPVVAEGRIIHRGRTVATADGDLKDGKGRIYAHATTTCMIFPAKT